MDMAELTKHDVVGLLEAGACLVTLSHEAPSGNFPFGRTLEEYRLRDRRYLQVAWNDATSADQPRFRRLDSYHLSAESLAYWYV